MAFHKGEFFGLCTLFSWAWLVHLSTRGRKYDHKDIHVACAKQGEERHTCCMGRDALWNERKCILCIFQGGALLARRVEPFCLFLEGLAVFSLFRSALSFDLVVSSLLPMSLGTKFLLHFCYPVTLFQLVPSLCSLGCAIFFLLLSLCWMLTMHSSRGRLRTHGWFRSNVFSCVIEWLSTVNILLLFSFISLLRLRLPRHTRCVGNVLLGLCCAGVRSRNRWSTDRWRWSGTCHADGPCGGEGWTWSLHWRTGRRATNRGLTTGTSTSAGRHGGGRALRRNTRGRFVGLGLKTNGGGCTRGVILAGRFSWFGPQNHGSGFLGFRLKT